MNINPIVLSIPVFFVLIGTELLVERFSHEKLYRLPDAIVNISCKITLQLSGLFLLIFGIGIYQLLFAHFGFLSLKAIFALPECYYALAFVYFIISGTWFYSLQRQHEHLQIA